MLLPRKMLRAGLPMMDTEHAKVKRSKAFGKAHQTVTAQDAVGWFAHCGYPGMQS